MNLTRVLNVALPEMPARIGGQFCPRVPPDAVFKEHFEDGQWIVRVVVPSQDAMYRFPSQNWALISLFDGRRSFEEIARVYSGQMGTEYCEEDIREFAASLDAMEFWYKTPQEKNIELMRKSVDERRKLLKSKKSKFGNLAEIAFPAVNPDNFLNWLYRYTSFIYSWWFTALTLVLFSISAGITLIHWPAIGRDTIQFFNFTNKSWSDVAQFYVLAVLTMCWHEIGHGHACKICDARVPSMGFMLIYLTPAFFTDTSEGHIKGTRLQRLIISIAGVWSELIIYAVATLIWWGTPPDTTANNLAYLLMLITGIFSVFINWNPLIKLDGYYMMCEILGIANLKELSTAYVSAWVKHYIWRLPVEVPYVPKSRRVGFAVYALLSGAYSYMVLYVVARFVGNVFRNFNPDWSFIPELGTAALIFRSRIRMAVNFMKFVYLDKKEHVRYWLSSRPALVGGVALIVLLLLPFFHEAAVGHFKLEPSSGAVIRAVVPGIITDIYAEEGACVTSGAPLLQLRNLSLESSFGRARADHDVSTSRAVSAALKYTDFGPALKERNQFSEQDREQGARIARLELISPVSGTVLTPRLSDQLGRYIPDGTEVVEVADLSLMRARVYISEHDLDKFQVGSPARLQVEGLFPKWDSHVVAISPVSSEIDPALAGELKYKGLRPPNFYVAELILENPKGLLRPGMVGLARIYGRRTSLAGLVWQEITHFFERKIW
jgi:putative peptide zinc metalloprotease protein